MVRHFDYSLELLAFKVIEFAKNFVLLDVKFDIVGGIFVLNFDVLEVIGEGLDY